MPIAALDRSTPRKRFNAFAAAASTRVQQLREVLDHDDPVADEYHMRSIADNAMQQHGERLTLALEWMKEIGNGDDNRAPSKRRTPKACSKRHSPPIR